MVDVAQVLKVLDGEMVPLHEKHARHEAVRDQHADARKVILAKLPPQALVEATNAIVGIGGALAVGDAVEEVAVVGSLLPHALHLGAAGLKVAKVLLAQPRLLVDLDVGALKGRGLALVGRQRGEDAFGRLAGSTVGRCEEVQCVVGAEELAKALASFVGLGPAFGRELDSVVGDALVDFSIFWAYLLDAWKIIE